MNPRDRVLAALEHGRTDRVPVDFSGHRSSGIAAPAYARLRAHLGLELRAIRVYDPLQQLALVEDDVLERFGVDTIELGRGFSLADEDWAYWVLPDGTPCLVPKWFKPQRDGRRWVLRAPSGRTVGELAGGASTFQPTYHPFAEQDDLEALPNALAECLGTGCPSPPGPAVGPLELSRGARKLRANTDRAILGLFGGSLAALGQALYGAARFDVLLAHEPQRARELLDRLVETHIAKLERYLMAVGPFIDIVVFDEDFGAPPGTARSRDVYREFFQPGHQRLWRRAKELANVKVLLRCGGDFQALAPDLIEAGVDAMQGVLFHSRAEDVERIVSEFGRRVAFWGGGRELHAVLPHGTPQDVAAQVQRQLANFSSTGGFVFQPAHNVPGNVPPENIVALFDAVRGERG